MDTASNGSKGDTARLGPGADSSVPAPQVDAKPKKPKAIADRDAKVLAARADYFTPGNIVQGYSGFDEVLAYEATEGGGFKVTVHEVKKVGDQWHRVGKPQDRRQHSTLPESRQIAAGPVARLGYAPAAEVVYTSPRSDGQPFPNAVDRGTAPAAPAAAPAPAPAAPSGYVLFTGPQEGGFPLVIDREAMMRSRLANEQKRLIQPGMSQEVADAFTASGLKEARESFDAQGKFVGDRFQVTVPTRGAYLFGTKTEALEFAEITGMPKGRKRVMTPAPAPADVSAPAVPAGVLAAVKRSLDRLSEIEDSLASVERARGRGQILALEVESKREQIASALARLEQFRALAKEKGIDAEAIIQELGGEPDLKRFNAAPAPAAAPVADKAEIRPFRRADGSIGYEAVPIRDAAADLKGKAAGDMLEMGNGTLYRIEGVDDATDRLRLVRNPNQTNERTVLLGQYEYDRLLADDAETKAAQAPKASPEEPNLAAARALIAEQKAATGNPKAEAEVRRKARELASKTPATDEKTVLALDMIATRLGMGDGNKKDLEFAPAATPSATPLAQGLTPPAAAAKADPLTEQEKAAKAKMLNAAGKLAALLSKNTRASITPEQEQQMLPIVIELFEGAMDLGYVKFKQAARYVREFIANAIDQEAADSIPIDTLQGAYIATSRRHKDKDITPKGEVVTIESVAELEEPAEQADTGAPENANDTQSDGADDAEPLDPQLPAGNPELAEGLAPETSASVRQPDAAGNGRAGGGRAGRRTGMVRGSKPVLPKTPTEVRPTGRSPVAGEPDAQNQLFGDAPGNYEITAEDAIGEGTEGQKLRANMEAIRTLRRIQADNRNATPEEQAVMAKFIGWGGLRKLIDPNTTGKQWLDARAELLGTNGQPPLLVAGDKGSEWISLQRSTTAAHFTAPEVVTSMWGVVRHFGFAGGRVLEPTSGIGNFIGLQPRDLAAASEWHGAELDLITGQMAKLIYPEASIAAGTGFENVPFAKGAFDLAIGNPPFGSLTLTSDVAAYKGIPSMKIHNFIISKTGEHLRPGGVMAMVVTHRFLDTANPEAREHLAKSFRFLGAFRLPNDAFLKNAGTEVTTDVVFLQKLHVGERAADLSWLDTEGSIQVDGQAIRVSRYYEQNPANILGRSAMDGTMYAGRQDKDIGEYTVHSDGRDLTKAIQDMLTNQWADLKDVAKATNDDASVAAVMIQQSDLPVGGVMLSADGKLLRRDMDDEGGNAVVAEITPQSLWREGAEKWKRALDVLTTLKNKNLLAAPEGMAQFKEAIAVAYTAKGEKKPKPTKAEQAVYDIADALDRPGFAWRFDAQLDAIQAAVQRGMLGKNGYARIKGLVGLRNTTLALIEAERSDREAGMKELRDRLNTEYDAFVAIHGLVNEPDNSGLLDGDIGVESGLEAGYRPKNGKVKASASKADIFTRRVNFPYREVTSAKDAADGLQVSISERGRLDIPYIAGLTGQTSQQVIAELSSGSSPSIFLDPDTSEYTDADDYLSGNVKVKLQKAKDAGLRSNVIALEAVQPVPKTKESVRPSIRGAWMPESVFSDFLTDLGVQSPRVSIIASQGMADSKVKCNTLGFNERGWNVAGCSGEVPDRPPVAIVRPGLSWAGC